MADRFDMEDAVFDVEGAAALFEVVRQAVLQHDGQQWAAVNSEPQDGMRVAVFTEGQWRAVDHAATVLKEAVDRLSLAFNGAKTRSRS